MAPEADDDLKGKIGLEFWEEVGRWSVSPQKPQKPRGWLCRLWRQLQQEIWFYPLLFAGGLILGLALFVLAFELGYFK